MIQPRFQGAIVTISKKLVVDMSDIHVVRITCHQCPTSLSLAIDDKKNDPPEKCPNCGAPWYAYGSTEMSQINTLLAALKEFRSRHGKRERQISLEITQQTEPANSFPD